MKGTELLEKLEIPSALAEAAKESLKKGIGEFAKATLKARDASELLSLIASEGAATLAAALVGPWLRVLLRVADQTQGKLDKMIREPFISGKAKAKRMLNMKVVTSVDLELRNAEFCSAFEDLNKAYSFADKKGDQIRRLQIRVLQIVMAVFMGAPGYAASYGDELMETFDIAISEASQQVDSDERTLANLRHRDGLTPAELQELRRVRLEEGERAMQDFWGPDKSDLPLRLQARRMARQAILSETEKPSSDQIARASTALHGSQTRLVKFKAAKKILQV